MLLRGYDNKNHQSMLLKLKDTNKTLITQINTEIDRFGGWSEKDGYYYVLTINNMALKYIGNNANILSKQDYDKLIRKGAKRVFHAQCSEQEQQHHDALEADLNNPQKHGMTIHSILCGERSEIYVWDYYKRKVVKEGELTKI